MKFTELPLHQDVLKGIEYAGFTESMPVQERVLPIVLQGKDVMVQSKTGSGKTAVFVLAILEKYARALEAAGGEKKSLPTALIVCPTRELAVQIEEDAVILAKGLPDFRIGCFYGGVGYAQQDKMLEVGCDLYVGTPGRLLDYHKMHKIDYRLFDTFVIDEADRLFDMGFYPDVQKMFSYLRPSSERQTMLFSATLGTKVRNLAWQYMNEPVEIEVQPEEITVKKIDQELYHITKDEKFHLFLQLLKRENPENALIFTNTKAKAVELAKRLTLNGYKTEYLMGDLPQSKRLQTIDRMKEGKLKFLVATDVAARGLQIDGLQLVFNYDIPEDFESYVHRIGRTARAGHTGKAITLADEEYIYGLEPIENYIQMKIPVVWPAPDELPEVEDKSAGMRFRDLVSQDEYASHGGDRYGNNNRGGRRPSTGGGQRQRGGRPSGGTRDGSQQRSGAPRTSDRPARPDSERRPDSRRSSAPVRDGQPRRDGGAPRKGPQSQQQRRPQGSKNYSQIQSMDLEQRMAYYKQQYGSELEQTPAKAPKKQGAPVAKKSPAQPKQAQPAQPQQAAPVAKKPGFFARLFGKGNKKTK